MSLWKDKASGTYKFTFQVNGKVHGGGGFKTKAEARTAREEKRSRILSGSDSLASPLTKTPTAMGFEEVANSYLDGSKRRHVAKTYQYKADVYKKFVKHAGDRPISDVTPFHIQEYLRTCPSNVTYNRQRKELGALFEYARKIVGAVRLNPCVVIEKLPEEKKPKAIPTQEEFVRMISEATEEESPFLVILACTAARIDEALRLKWEDVNFERSYVRLWTKKTKDGSYRSREIPMNTILKGYLLELWEKRVQNEWVLFNQRTKTRYVRNHRFMGRLCKRLGIPHYGFHSIRHFVCSYLLDQEKIGKPTMSRMLGHRSLTTTDIYAHSIGVHDVDDAMDIAVDKLETVFSPKLIPATGCGSIEDK